MEELNIPEPFKADKFELFQEGIYDNPSISVYINGKRNFAFLHPKPVFNYKKYEPRVKKLKQEAYKKQQLVYEDRFNKIKHILGSDISSLIEIGAGDGSFLGLIKHELPYVELAAVETDVNTDNQRRQISDLINFRDLDEVCVNRIRYDAVCLFHVIEHIIDPSTFLSKVHRSLMHKNSIIVVEVPSLYDPLLSLYGCESYKRFYFQSQHPYIYSHTSIVRLMERNGFMTKGVISYQRYGIENHLNWFANDTPGGSQLFRNIFNKTNKSYISELEDFGKTDTVIWIGKLN